MTGQIEQARNAAVRGDHPTALALLREVESSTELDRDGLTLLAEVAYAAGHLETTFDAWERVHALGLRQQDPVAAATGAARIAMHLLMDTGLLAPVRVWVKRAERLLEGHGTTPVHATLAIAHGYERLLSGDVSAARELSRRAIEVGTEHEVPASVALGQVMEARSTLFGRDLPRGLELLDESATVVLLDGLDPLSAGVVYCELVCAWQGLAQYDRAEELTEAMERWSRDHRALGSVHGRCRVHRAEMLRLRGPLPDAEDEALAACEELRPYLRREFGWPLTELGTIRLQRGDLDGAEEVLLEAHRAGWEPQPGLALLRLAQGQVDVAVATIRDALDHPRNVPSKELPPCNDLRRAPLLAAQVEIGVAAGRVDEAAAAAAEFERIAWAFQSRALQARAAFGRGLIALATDDAATARRQLKRAVDGHHDLAMPYETARARAALARAYRTGGDHHLAALEIDAAAEIFLRIGVEPGLHLGDGLATAVPVPEVSRDAAPSTGEAAHRPSDPCERAGSLDGRCNNRVRAEGDHWSLTFAGETVRLRDLKGLRYLARLLAEPGREFHVLDLVTAEEGGPARTGASAEAAGEGGPEAATTSDLGVGPLLDEQAKAAFRRRITEVEEDRDEAQAAGDVERTASAELERDFLLRELSRAVGIGGRDRPAGAAAERARVSVTRAVRYALQRVGEHHPPLGAHLDHAVRTGTYTSYAPDPASPIDWEVSTGRTTPT